MTNPWREIEAAWQGGSVFRGENNDGAITIGKQDGKGISPMEALLVALAGCAGSDVVSIMEKKKQPIEELRIRVRGKRADTMPAIFTEIQMEFTLKGSALKEKDVEEAIRLSEEKYCSVGAMLNKAASIHTTFHIVPGK